jgi:5-formyltetrahydrofolate cyclo-ligase
MSAARGVWEVLSRVPASILVGYVPIRGEVDTIYAINRVLQGSWKVAVPCCHSKEGIPTLLALPENVLLPGPGEPAWNTAKLEPDAWGMLAPRVRVPVRAGAVGAILVPGLAFDRAGYRLGRGAGVYDRLLASLPEHVLRIGLIPSARLVETLPREAHDVPMHAVVTPEGVHRPAPVG